MFEERVKNARIAVGLSQDDVANKVGITQVAYSYIERGLKTPSLPIAVRIAHTLNVSLDYLTNNEHTTN